MVTRMCISMLVCTFSLINQEVRREIDVKLHNHSPIHINQPVVGCFSLSRFYLSVIINHTRDPFAVLTINCCHQLYLREFFVTAGKINKLVRCSKEQRDLLSVSEFDFPMWAPLQHDDSKKNRPMNELPHVSPLHFLWYRATGVRCESNVT